MNKPMWWPRFESRFTVDESGCWLWTGYVKPSGYATMSVNSKMQWVHRLSYEVLVGPIPAGLQLDHLCRVRNCVNPAHLEPVTGRENTIRSYAARNSGISGMPFPTVNHACSFGHERTEANSYSNANGAIICRVCQRRRQAEKYQRRTKLGLPQRKSSRG